MKKLFLLLLPLLTFSQYSNYYQVDVNQKVDANVTVNQNVSGEITYKTIDYGALASANAAKERTRLERLMYENEEERRRAYEIAQNPLNAYKYGEWIWQKVSKKQNGYKKTWFYLRYLNQALFKQSGAGFNNTSEDFVETRLALFYPQKFDKKHFIKNNGEPLPLFYEKILELKNPAVFCKLPFINVGDKVDLNNDGVEEYFHKKEFSRARILGQQAYVSSVFCEDDFEIFIKDYYVAVADNKLYVTVATFKGDKKLVNFEQLEGRRYYFKNLISEFFSTAYESDKNPKSAAFWKAMLTPQY